MSVMAAGRQAFCCLAYCFCLCVIVRVCVKMCVGVWLAEELSSLLKVRCTPTLPLTPSVSLYSLLSLPQSHYPTVPASFSLSIYKSLPPPFLFCAHCACALILLMCSFPNSLSLSDSLSLSPHTFK